MRSTLGVLACLALLIPAAAAADASAEARSAIEQANARFAKEFEQRNAAAVAAMYTEDAIVLPPGQEMVKGRPAIEQFWKSTMNAGVKSAVLTTLDVTISGDMVSEVGTVELTIAPEGKPATKSFAKYLVAWKREGGAWKLHRDIWNDLPSEE
jgi:uncharacterized protein (TIGR02246 family)